MKQEGHPLRPFFNEWPKSKDSWFGREDERSNQTALSQLNSQYPFSCRLLTSLQRALNPRMVRFKLGEVSVCEHQPTESCTYILADN